MPLFENMKRATGVALLAQKTTSYAAFDGGVFDRVVQAHTVRDYFRKHATWHPQFTHISEYNTYFGYVSALGRPEFLSFVSLKKDCSIIVSYFVNPKEFEGSEGVNNRDDLGSGLIAKRAL